jgi:ubiquinone/menaquinone biosynthesis C-methylase UbiE
MPKPFLPLPAPHCVLFLISVLNISFFQDSLNGKESDAYSFGEASPDGIGKYYMGREISKVMGHLGAGWLERPQREREERTDLLVQNLNLQPSDQVVDLGAGSGYFTFRIAPKLPQGKVYAVDISKEMLGIVRAKIKKLNFENVIPVHGTVTDFDIQSGTIDSILVVDAYHEFSHPLEMGKSIFEALKPGGKLVLIEYRMEDPLVPIKRLHKMSQKQAIKELSATGLKWVKTLEFLPQQHFMIFQKPKP